ncbi:S-layer homology domain-containing protein [Paenibacillus sp. MMO-58]|uniref:S-layer homology domain-containing protein n=1 Tax=Paenibacillus sp. MMO-58 TaxID=3081290 RepID=UPI00301715E8
MILSSAKKLRRCMTSALLATTMVATMFAGTANAGSLPQITLSVSQPDPAPIYRGDTTTFLVDAANIDLVDENGLQALIFNVDYDPAVFDEQGYTVDDMLYQPSGISTNPALDPNMEVMPAFISHIDEEHSRLTFTVMSSDSEATLKPAVRSFLSFKLHVKDDAKLGDTSIAVSPFDESSIVDSNGQTVPTENVKGSSTTFNIQALPTLQSVSAHADTLSLLPGGSTSVHLQGSYSDSAVADLTSAATWTTDNPIVANVSSTGVVTTGVIMGNAKITGTYNGQSASVTISVVPIITPPLPIFLGLVPSRDSVQIDHVGEVTPVFMQEMWSTGPVNVTTTGTWTSSDQNVVIVLNGAVNAMGLGDATITYTNSNGTISIPVHVGPVAQPKLEYIYFGDSMNDPVGVGDAIEPEIIGHYEDGSDKTLDPADFTYTIDDESVAVVNGDLVVTGVHDGITKITVQLTDNPSIETIWNYVWVVNNVLAPPSFSHIAITPDFDSIEVGDSKDLQANVIFSSADGALSYDLSRYVIWSSDNESVLTVDKQGNLTAVSEGHATITAELPILGVATLDVEVVPLPPVSMEVLPSPVSVSIGATKQLAVNALFANNPTPVDLASQATYVVANPAVATVSEGGLVTGVSAGTTSVTVKLGELTQVVTLQVMTSGSDGSGGSGGGTVVTPPAVTPPIVLKVDYNVNVLQDLLKKAEQAQSQAFTDISQASWAANAIQRATNAGIINGYGNGTFQPNATITRAEFATMVAKAFGLTNKNGSGFPDTSNHWASQSIEALADQGLLTGYGDGTFKPDHEITRAEMVVVLSRLTDYQKQTATTFNDISSSWASEQIKAFANAGIIDGKSQTTFAPNDSATRAESVTILMRLLDQLVKS